MIISLGAELVKMLGIKNYQMCQIRSMAGLHVAFRGNALSNSGIRIGRKLEWYSESVKRGRNSHASHWALLVSL